MGHDIAPGASYCAQGHPIALDAMQFANDAYGPGGGGGGGYAQQQQQPAYPGAPPPQQYGGYGGAPQPSPSPIGGPGGFGAPDPNQQPQYGGGYGQQQQQQPMNPQFAPQVAGPTPYPGMPAQQGQYGGVPQQPYDPQQQGYGAQQPQYGGAPQGYAPPQQAQQPVFNPAPAPPAPAPVAAPAPAAALAPSASPDPNNKTLRGFLVAYGTNANGDFWPLTGGRHVVGRSGAGDGIDIQLSDPTISSRHAVIVVDGVNATLALEDTGSTNGTFVNDDHLGFNGRRDLRDGDRLRFGGFTTVVKVVGRV
jgi:pSer/pThr/pTyr-binding forkhead associated (FHA) protein